MASVLLGWEVWYSDGTRLSSRTHKWVDVPVMDVQAVKKYYDNGQTVLIDQDMYIMVADNNPVEIQRLINQDIRNVKIGKYMGRKSYETLRTLVYDKIWQ